VILLEHAEVPPFALRAGDEVFLGGDLDDVLVALHPHRGAPVPLLVADQDDLLREERVRGADDRADVEGVLRAADRDPGGMADAVERALDLVERHAERWHVGHRARTVAPGVRLGKAVAIASAGGSMRYTALSRAWRAGRRMR